MRVGSPILLKFKLRKPDGNDPAAIHRFGPFTFDARARILTRNGVPVPLSGLPLRMLQLFVASPGKLVTRTEFKQVLWPHAVRIDTERRLNTAMRALRDALGDHAMQPNYIQTVRNQGYRWIGRKAAPKRPLAVAAATGLALLLPAPAISPDAIRAAQVRQVEDSFAKWRENPSPDEAAAVGHRLRAAQSAIGPLPEFDALAAEHILAGHWDWRTAERLYRRALAHDPDNDAARRGLAWLYVNSGRTDQAWSEAARLLATANLTDDTRADLGWMMLRMERADLALALCASPPDRHLNILSCRHTALASLGAVGEARDVAVALLETLKADADILAAVRDGPPAKGYRRFLAWRVAGFVPPDGRWFQRAQLQAEAGLFDDALMSLEKAAAARDPMLVKIGSTLAFRPLESEPRFRALRRDVLSRG